jgi:hypothetical protein
MPQGLGNKDNEKARGGAVQKGATANLGKREAKAVLFIRVQ